MEAAMTSRVPALRPQTFQRSLKVLPQTQGTVRELTKGYPMFSVSAVSTGIREKQINIEVNIAAHSLE